MFFLIPIFTVLAILIIITFITSIHNLEIPMTRIYKILTFIVIVLFIIQIILKINNYRLFPKYNLTSEISYYLTLGWFYVTGILIIRRAILFFRDGEILSGIMLFLTGLLILVFAFHIVTYLYIFIGNNTLKYTHKYLL